MDFVLPLPLWQPGDVLLPAPATTPGRTCRPHLASLLLHAPAGLLGRRPGRLHLRQVSGGGHVARVQGRPRHVPSAVGWAKNAKTWVFFYNLMGLSSAINETDVFSSPKQRFPSFPYQ